MKVEKSPISPPLAFAFTINSSGISLLTDDGKEMVVPETNAICRQGRFARLAFGESAGPF